MYERSHIPPDGASPAPESVSRSAEDPRRRIEGGRFVLLDELGRGGMGIVYRAWDAQLGREVAAKLLTQTTSTGEAERQRFFREANAVMRLRHPSIVPIHHVGEHERRPYLVMPLIEGGDLEQALRRDEVPPRRLAEVVRDIALALDFAHREGFIHRDVKPENIMLPPHTRPILMDFGLARDLTSDERLTVTGEVVGTPNYMAPEQVDGESGSEPRSDVYALGAVLYRGLCGRPPFVAEMPFQVITMLLMEEPRAPTLVNPDVDPCLEAITLRCLDKDPTRRYESARALADELDRWLRGEETEVRPLTSSERTGRRVRAWGRRARARLRASLPMLLVALALGSAGATALVVLGRRSRTGGGAASGPTDPADALRADFDATFAAAVGGDIEALERAGGLLDAVERADAEGARREQVRMIRRLAGLVRGDEGLLRSLPLDQAPWADHQAGIARLLAAADQPRMLGGLLERFGGLVRDDSLRDDLAAAIIAGKLVPTAAIVEPILDGLRREELARRPDRAERARLRALRAGALARYRDALVVKSDAPLDRLAAVAAELVRLLQLGVAAPATSDIARERLLERGRAAFELPELPRGHKNVEEDIARELDLMRHRTLLLEAAVWDARLRGDATTEAGIYDNAHLIIFTNFSSTDQAVRMRTHEVGAMLMRLGYWTPRELLDTDVSRNMLIELARAEAARGPESLDPARLWSLFRASHRHAVKEAIAKREIAEPLANALTLRESWAFVAPVLARERAREDVPGFVLAWLADTVADAFEWRDGRPYPLYQGGGELIAQIEADGAGLIAKGGDQLDLRGLIDRLHELAASREAEAAPERRRTDVPLLRVAWTTRHARELAAPETVEAVASALEGLVGVDERLVSEGWLRKLRELGIEAARRAAEARIAKGDTAAFERLADAVSRAAPQSPLFDEIENELRSAKGGK